MGNSLNRVKLEMDDSRPLLPSTLYWRPILLYPSVDWRPILYSTLLWTGGLSYTLPFCGQTPSPILYPSVDWRPILYYTIIHYTIIQYSIAQYCIVQYILLQHVIHVQPANALYQLAVLQLFHFFQITIGRTKRVITANLQALPLKCH